MKFRRLAVLLMLLLSPAMGLSDDGDDITDQKDELEKIQDEVDRSRHKLDSLKNAEINVRGRIAENDQKIASNRKVINRLSNQQRSLRDQISEAENALQDRQDKLEFARRRYLGNLRELYLAARQPAGIVPDRPNLELELNRQIVYLTAVAGFESGNVDLAVSYLGQANQRKDDLSGEDRRITKLKKKKETSSALERSRKEKREKHLDVLRRKRAAESDRILTLKQAAREIETIIARLEQERRRELEAAGDYADRPSIFATFKGQLRSPYSAKVVVPYGRRVDQITNLKSFSPGITIEGRPGRPVVAVATGEIAYVGSLRGYGNFVIINHDDQYYTTYGGLGTPVVVEGQFVATGDQLAPSGETGQVKFEIRKGRQSEDPVKWIRIDSF